MKKEVAKVGYLLPATEKIFNLTKQNAMNRLIAEGITQSEQMLNKWCREGLIQAVRISKGAPKNRGIRISEESLNAFIAKKNGCIDELTSMLDKKEKEIKELKQQLTKAQNEIRRLEVLNETPSSASKKNANIQNFFLFTDLAEATFEYRNEQFSVLFDTSTDEIIQITRITKRSGSKDATDTFTEQEKKAILEIRAKEKVHYLLKH